MGANEDRALLCYDVSLMDFGTAKHDIFSSLLRSTLVRILFGTSFHPLLDERGCCPKIRRIEIRFTPQEKYFKFLKVATKRIIGEEYVFHRCKFQQFRISYSILVLIAGVLSWVPYIKEYEVGYFVCCSAIWRLIDAEEFARFAEELPSQRKRIYTPEVTLKAFLTSFRNS